MDRNRNYQAATLPAALVSGSLASVTSAAALAVLGSRELGNAVTPLNGPSQWVWGRHAPYCSEFSLRHTVLGYFIHHLASVFWALCFERMARRRREPLRSAVATALLASVVDFTCTPQRFRPGFEKRLSRRSLFLVYGAFAAGLAAAAYVRR